MLTIKLYNSSDHLQASSSERLLEKCDRLERKELILAVLQCNPNVAAAQEAWRSSMYRYPQAVALQDPMLSYSFAPDSIGHKTFHHQPVRYGQSIELSQKVHVPGKLAAKGRMAIADAEKMQGDFEQVKLELIETTSMLFDDYFLIQKALEVNKCHLTLLNDVNNSAESLYITGSMIEQDWLQIGLEIDEMENERVALQAEQKIFIAKINALLHRTADTKLPLPPDSLPLVAGNVENREQLQQEAIEKRPDLHSLRAEIEKSKAAISHAEFEYYPDFVFSASYDSKWDQPQYRPNVGVSMNIPFVQLEKRKSAVHEALCNHKRLESEYLALIDKSRVEIEEALQGMIQNERIVHLWQESGLPLAKEKLSSAIVNYEAGIGNLLTLLEADRNQRTIELRLYSAIAASWKSKAKLDYALGRLP